MTEKKEFRPSPKSIAIVMQLYSKGDLKNSGKGSLAGKNNWKCTWSSISNGERNSLSYRLP
jgi:hypothetical protein